MLGEDQKDIEISISEIYDRLQHVPMPMPKKEKKPEEFKELHDEVNENRVRKACTEVSGDIDYKRLLVFKTHPVAAALKAFRNDSVIYVDTPLMRAAILSKIQEENEKLLIEKPRGGFDSDKPVKKVVLKIPEIICVADHPKAEEFSKKYNVSKSMAGFMVLKDDVKKSIVIIGKDDAALLSVGRMAERGSLPYLILGFPAGINTQITSKDYLTEIPELPLITMSQTKGGVEAAAACLVELMKIYEEGL
ncbi:precorrin-8X methylmutase [Methanimicrococcus blatticola]|uniref:Precorrin-8X methylmutase n=1 Tax=Methanimicrococcus blatticola TaxID=91560 RepID=A0A484F7V9_9EURY|nr:precorrin-8X methylmutase [Methanimicrococcus blatticola]MBZ3935061.1 precorrin-8X methylmutase [Methanimicrococcus blatticola]MCC2508842.1 precorrin-8X methylmutase [Methanimicrococcus blatticola]TDQ71131.1 precorrin-8X methylmutase [Methanimicrococcus blatticola]